MNLMRNRVKEHFPTVLLTLLSIVQALALELLWAHLTNASGLFEGSWVAIALWLQIIATFFGVTLIWVVYASNVMRFRWVPTTSDSVYPFFIGLIEFMLIEALGLAHLGLWLILMGTVFAVMTWVAHATMRRAREDSDNATFFASSTPAVLADFYPQLAIVGILLLSGTYFLVAEGGPVAITTILLGTVAVLVYQFHSASKFWQRSVAEELEDQELKDSSAAQRDSAS